MRFEGVDMMTDATMQDELRVTDRKPDVLVPGGMLSAAWRAVADKMKESIRISGEGHIAELHVARIAIQTALRWQGDNSAGPTDREFGEMVKVCRDANSAKWEALSEWNRAIILCGHWARHMYDAPLDPLANFTADPEKERYRIALEKLAKLGNEPFYGNSDGNTIAQEALRVGKFSPKPPESKAPEAVKDLLWHFGDDESALDKRHNELAIEAYNRGWMQGRKG